MATLPASKRRRDSGSLAQTELSLCREATIAAPGGEVLADLSIGRSVESARRGHGEPRVVGDPIRLPRLTPISGKCLLEMR